MPDPTGLPQLKHFHHVAFRCRDAEETRRFYQDLLGLKLAAGLAFDEISGTETALRYLHLFFELGDGNFLAFFDAPDSATEEHFKPRSGFNRHIAIETEDLTALATYRQRLHEHGVRCEGPLDHGFVQSIYFYDPNGINVEITARTPRYDEIMADEADKAAAEMARWTSSTQELKRQRGLRAPGNGATAK